MTFALSFVCAKPASSSPSCAFSSARQRDRQPVHAFSPYAASTQARRADCQLLPAFFWPRTILPGLSSRHVTAVENCDCNAISHVNLRLTKTESFNPKRQTWSIAFEIPIRFPRTMDGVVDRPSNLKGGLSRRFPLSASLTPRACPSRPGPEHSNRRSVLARRRIIRGMPAVGSSDRIRTPAAWPASRHTKFKHQWIP